MAALPLEVLINVASYIPVAHHEAVARVARRWYTAITATWPPSVWMFGPNRVPGLRSAGSTDGGARIELAIWHVMRMLPGPSPLAGRECALAPEALQALHKRLYGRPTPCLFDEFSYILTEVVFRGPLPGLCAFELQWVLTAVVHVLTAARRQVETCRAIFMVFCCADLLDKWQARSESIAHPFDQAVAAAIAKDLLLTVDVLFLDGLPCEAQLGVVETGQLFHFAALHRLRRCCQRVPTLEKWETRRRTILADVEKGG
eukprot:EG_transcript_23871